MRHGQAEKTPAWYWTDGNDVENTGVWTHAYDNSDVTFFSPRLACGCTDRDCPGGGDAFMVHVGLHYRGNYCDFNSNNVRHFICENTI